MKEQLQNSMDGICNINAKSGICRCVKYGQTVYPVLLKVRAVFSVAGFFTSCTQREI